MMLLIVNVPNDCMCGCVYVREKEREQDVEKGSIPRNGALEYPKGYVFKRRLNGIYNT